MLGVVTATLTIGAGCSDDDAEANPKIGNGVNDVRKSCDLRAQWNRENNDCSLCEAAVVSPRCECEALKEFSSVCIDQENARQAACAEPVRNCVLGCDRGDCSCVDACYASANSPDCKRASDARDGCIAEACTPKCK